MFGGRLSCVVPASSEDARVDPIGFWRGGVAGLPPGNIHMLVSVLLVVMASALTKPGTRHSVSFMTSC